MKRSKFKNMAYKQVTPEMMKEVKNYKQKNIGGKKQHDK